MRECVAKFGPVFIVLLSLYVDDTSTTYCHVVVLKYADITSLVATSQSASLLLYFLEVYVDRLELRLCDCTFDTKVPKTTAVVIVKAARRIENPSRAVQFSGESVGLACYLAMILDTKHTLPTHIHQTGK
jgi:hypothetical protein